MCGVKKKKKPLIQINRVIFSTIKEDKRKGLIMRKNKRASMLASDDCAGPGPRPSLRILGRPNKSSYQFGGEKREILNNLSTYQNALGCHLAVLAPFTWLAPFCSSYLIISTKLNSRPQPAALACLHPHTCMIPVPQQSIHPPKNTLSLSL